MEKPVSSMRKGFDELQEMKSRTQKNVPWKPPTGSKINLRKASKAVRQYYEKQAEEGMANPFVSGYIPEVEELQKTFLMRPGCPRYSHRATSTANLEGHFSKIAGLPSNISTISLTSQLSLDDWTSILQNTDLLESKCCSRYGQSGSSQNLPGLSKWKSSTEVAALAFPTKIHAGSKIPWYIAVLQEKEMALQKLAEELVRLSNCEAESAHKDDVISILREEVEAMQQKLDHLQWESLVIPHQTPEEKGATEPAVADGSARSPRRRGTSLPTNWEQRSVPEEFLKEIEDLKLELAQKAKALDMEAGLLSETPLKDQEQLEKEPTRRLETGEETLMGTESKESKEMVESEVWPDDMEETEEEMIIRKLFEFQRMNNELYEELEKMKNDYDIATGAISSLQRQLSFEGSQLHKAHAERESLQKELRERGDQLEAMSNKFCNLREERKHGDMMGSIEMENYKLRQDVADLESKLEDKSQLIDSLQSNVSRLQAEVAVNQHNTGKQLRQQNELQRQLEILQRGEQQTRVILESISSRFDRFRSRIIQATYSSPGTKSPQAEISDDEVLEALQKIITDRMEFHQMLKQQGVKVPSLYSESISPSSNKKKNASK